MKEDSLKNCEVKVWIDFRLSSSRGHQISRTCCCCVVALLLLLYEADIVAGVNCYKKTVNHLMAGPQLSGVEVSVTSPVKDDHC